MDFGDLQNDKKVQDKLQNFHNSVDKIENILNSTVTPEVYNKLTTEEKVNYDLFMGYTLNTLFWLYLRSKGVDPNDSEIKNQLYRIRQYMVKAKEAHDRNTIRPKINQEVAKRFVKHGIQHAQNDQGEPQTKRRK